MGKKELLRIVKTKDGNYLISSNHEGRGAYIINDNIFIKKVIKNKLLHKTFRSNVPDGIYVKLAKIMEDNNER